MKPSLCLVGVALMLFVALEQSSSAQDLIPSPLQPREYIETVLFLYVANGVTTVRGMQGAPGQLDLRDRAKRGELLAPNLYLAGPAFSGKTIKSVEEAIQRVGQQKAEGWDLLKVLSGLARDHYDAMARTAKEVGISFAGHVPADVGLLHAIQSGQETFDHLDGYIEYLQGEKGPVPDAKFQEIAKLTREAGVWVVPTMALWETLRGTADLATLLAFPELKYMPLQQIQQWKSAQENLLKNADFKPDVARNVIKNRMRLLKELHDGGVKILLGSDAPQRFSVPGFSIHREMKRMADAGMKPYDILRSGSYNVGLYLKEKDNFGTIEVRSLYHEVRYESLVDDPQDKCRKLCGFLDVRYDEAMLRFHEGRTRRKPGLGAKASWLPVTPGLRSWHQQMATEDVARFEAACGPLLDELGYVSGTGAVSEGQLERSMRLRAAFAAWARSRGRAIPKAWTGVAA
jgi:Amidohydrolase family